MILIFKISELFGQDSSKIGSISELDSLKVFKKNYIINLDISEKTFRSTFFAGNINNLNQAVFKNTINSNVSLSGITFKASVDYYRILTVSDNRKMPLNISFSFDRIQFDKMQVNPNINSGDLKFKNKEKGKDSISTYSTLKPVKLDTIPFPSILTSDIKFTLSRDSVRYKYNDSIYKNLFKDTTSLNIDTLIDYKKESITGFKKSKLSSIGFSKWFVPIKKLELGKSVLSYSELTFNDFLLNGFQSQIFLKEIFVAVAMGQNCTLTNNNSNYIPNIKESTKVILGRIGFGDQKENHLHFSFFTTISRYSGNNWNNSSNSSCRVAAIETKYKAIDNSIIYCELAKIFLKKNNLEDDESNKAIDELSWRLNYNKKLQKSNTNLEFTYLETGSSFKHPGNAFLINNQRSFNIKISNTYFRRINVSNELGWYDFNKDHSMNFSIHEIKNNLSISYSISSAIIIQGIYTKDYLTQISKLLSRKFMTSFSLYSLNGLFMNKWKTLNLTTLIDLGLYKNYYSDNESVSNNNNTYHLFINENIQTGLKNEINLSSDANFTRSILTENIYKYLFHFSDRIGFIKMISIEPGLEYSILNNYSASLKYFGSISINLRRVQFSAWYSKNISVYLNTSNMNGWLANAQLTIKL